MSAAALLAELGERGVRLRADGQNIRVEAPVGVLSPELQEQIRSAKAELLELIDPETTRGQLLALAEQEGIARALVLKLDAADLRGCMGLSDKVLRAFLLALDVSRRMDAGQVPSQWSHVALCAGCGPVWWHRAEWVTACPWCFRRKAGKAIPRPPVACGDCRHFVPDEINPAGGIGTCGQSGAVAFYPMKKHPCAEYRPANDRTSDEGAGDD